MGMEEPPPPPPKQEATPSSLAENVSNRDSSSSNEGLKDEEVDAEHAKQYGGRGAYKYYLKPVTWPSLIIFIISIVIFTFCQAFPSKFRPQGKWGRRPPTRPDAVHLMMLTRSCSSLRCMAQNVGRAPGTLSQHAAWHVSRHLCSFGRRLHNCNCRGFVVSILQFSETCFVQGGIL